MAGSNILAQAVYLWLVAQAVAGLYVHAMGIFEHGA
jgi:hypothetical protein